MGPVSKAELKQAFARGQAGVGTPFWAAGMAEPQPLASIRELRWLVFHRLGTNSSQPYDCKADFMRHHGYPVLILSQAAEAC